MSQGEQDFTYTGREWNQEIGLYYYRARWYRPETGGFLERDPILDASGVYGYGYVDGMPTDQIDPAGFQALRPTPYQKNKESRSSLRAFACRPTCVDAKKVCEANGGSFDTECCSEFERSCLDAVDDAWDKWREKAGPLERLLDEGRFVKGTERQILLGMAEMAAGAGVLVKGAGVALGSVAVSIVVVVGSTATTGGAGTIIGVGVAVEISVGGVALGAAEVAGGSVGVVDGWTRFMGSDDHYEVLSSSDARATLEKYAAAQSEAAKNLKKAKDGYAPEKCCRKRKPLIPEVEHSPVDVKPAPGSRPVIPADSRPKKLGH
jgi:RHS repeat-associated protein